MERVLCRYDAVTDTVGTPAVRRAIAARAQELVPRDRPGAFANAMMEMGATMCTPRSPKCLLCPVRESCKGFLQGIAQELPVKPKKKAQRVEHRAVLLCMCDGRVLIVRRNEKLLGGLYVFPDMPDGTDPAALCAHMEALGVRTAYDASLGHARHVFTHIIWEMDIHLLLADACAPVPDGRWVTREELAALPLPTAVRRARELAMGILEKGR